MLEALLSILIVAILGAGMYYTALKYVALRHNRDTIADEYKRAVETIHELEERNAMLEAERDTQMARMEQRNNSPQGFDAFNIRG